VDNASNVDPTVLLAAHHLSAEFALKDSSTMTVLANLAQETASNAVMLIPVFNAQPDSLFMMDNVLNAMIPIVTFAMPVAPIAMNAHPNSTPMNTNANHAVMAVTNVLTMKLAQFVLLDGILKEVSV